MSNHLNDHSYYNIIINDMDKHANNEFNGNARLLSVNIDLEILDYSFNQKLAEVKTSVEKKSKDTLFLKSTLLESGKAIAQASSLWSKEI